jgi:hypothetical protein
MKRFYFLSMLALFCFVNPMKVSGVPTSRETPVITHDSSYAKLGARAKRTYSDSLDKSDSIYSRTANILATAKADSFYSLGSYANGISRSKFLKARPTVVESLYIPGTGKMTYGNTYGYSEFGGFGNVFQLRLFGGSAYSTTSIDNVSNTSTLQFGGNRTDFILSADTFAQYWNKNGPLQPSMGIGVFTAHPQAKLHIKGSDGSASSIPLVIDTGTLVASPVMGAIEMTARHYYGTDSLGAVLSRRAFVLQNDTGTFPVVSSDSIYARAMACRTSYPDTLKPRKLFQSVLLGGAISDWQQTFRIDTIATSIFDYYTPTGGDAGGVKFPVSVNGGVMEIWNNLTTKSTRYYANGEIRWTGNNMRLMCTPCSFSPGICGNVINRGDEDWNIVGIRMGCTDSGFSRATLEIGCHGAVERGHNVPTLIMRTNTLVSPQIADAFENTGTHLYFTGLTDTGLARRPFIQQGDTVRTKVLILDNDTVYGGYSFSEFYLDSTNNAHVMPTLNVFYGVRLMHPGSTTPDIIQYTADTSKSQLIFKGTHSGYYNVTFTASYKTSSTDTMNFAIFKNNTKQANIMSRSFLSTASSLMCVSSTGIVPIALNDTISLRVACSSNGHTLTINNVNLTVSKLSTLP